MAVADFLHSFLKNFLPQAQQQFGEVGQLAIGGPSGYAQQQENQRQSQQLAQSLLMHKQNLARQTGLDEAGADQQSFENQQRLLQGLGQGIFQSAKPGEPNSLTAPATYEGDQDITVKPGALQKNHTYTITPESPLGLKMQLPPGQNLEVPDGEYFKIREGVIGKEDAATKLAENAAYLEKQGQSLHQSIDQRFQPDYYKGLYRGAVDPSASMYARDLHAGLNEAVERDKRQGSTTEFQAIRTKLDNFQSPWEKMQQQRQTRDQGIGERAQARMDTREDRSYQFHAGELDHLAKPLEDASIRVGRLRDTMNSGTIQGDSLTPAELMIVMAGGQGAGLRINQAEIQQTLGGRNKADELRAVLGTWKPGDTAFSIPPQQKAQMGKLVDLVQSKLNKRLSILNDTRSQLATSTSVPEHRQLLDRAHKALATVDVQDQLGVRPPLVAPPPPK